MEMTDQQGYERYPMTMAHPNFRPSKPMPIPGTEIYNGNGEVLRRDYIGTPQMMPPVMVKTEAEEDYYRAQGYEPAGKVDPSAWVRAHSDAPPDTYKPAQYPKWGTDAEGQPVLYQTAADDPHASPEDLAPPPMVSAGAEVVQPPPTEAQNMQAQMTAMNSAFGTLMEQFRELQAENAKLRADADATPPNPALQADPEGGAEDGAVVVSDAVEPRRKRAYVRKENK